MTFESILPIVVIVVLVVVNGVFVAAEFALVGAKRSRLQTLSENGSGAARWLLARFDLPTGKDGYIAIAQLGITLASIGLGMYGEPTIAGWLYGPFESAGLSEQAVHAAGFAIALSLITFMHVVFGEMIPKALALQAPESVSVAVSPFMRLFGAVFKPMVVALNWMALGLMRLLGIRDPGRTASLYTSKELAIVTEEVADSGQLGSVQRNLINNIFELEERTAEQVMTSRTRVRALAADTTSEVISQSIVDSPLSRYPVFEGSLDHVIGVLHVKDFIRASASGRSVALRSLVRDLPSVTASATAEDLLALFKIKRVHAALVVDEFGGTLGFVTMDDLIADVIEEEDSTDAEWISEQDDGSYVLDGEVTLAELSEDYGIDLPHGEIVTIGGLVLAAHGTLPKAGAVLRFGNYGIQVEEVLGLKITRVRLSTLETR